jgi:hypothetical protein
MPAPCFARLRHVVNNRDVSCNQNRLSFSRKARILIATDGSMVFLARNG